MLSGFCFFVMSELPLDADLMRRHRLALFKMLRRLHGVQVSRPEPHMLSEPLDDSLHDFFDAMTAIMMSTIALMRASMSALMLFSSSDLCHHQLNEWLERSLELSHLSVVNFAVS